MELAYVVVMKATLASYVAFVGISLMLWGGCLGHRYTAVAAVPAPASVSSAAGE